MAGQPSTDLQRQVNESFEAFRRSLQEMLSAEARRSVDLTLASIRSEGGPFRIEGVEVDVVIRELRLAADEPAPDGEPRGRRPSRSRRPSGAAKAGGDRRRGPRGNVRAALLAAFTDPDVSLDTGTLRRMLEENGIAASTANVHQQLSRLVQSGELTREGRGVYRLSPATEPAPPADGPAEAGPDAPA